MREARAECCETNFPPWPIRKIENRRDDFRWGANFSPHTSHAARLASAEAGLSLIL